MVKVPQGFLFLLALVKVYSPAPRV